MGADPRRASVHEHIAAIAARTTGEGDRVATLLTRRCWPGHGERMDPSAVDWLRRWGPRPALAALPSCGCAGGACPICN